DLPHGTETILLVEDEEAVRQLARRVLVLCGYTVLEARHGVEALNLLATYSGPLHLLVTDVVMPQMSGAMLAERVLAHRPRIPVLYLAGYADSTLLREGLGDRTLSVLSKPFSLTALACRVRELLDNSRAHSDQPASRKHGAEAPMHSR